MSFCVNCGNKLKQGAKFCNKCGSQVSQYTAGDYNPPKQEFNNYAPPVQNTPVFAPTGYAPYEEIKTGSSAETLESCWDFEDISSTSFPFSDEPVMSPDKTTDLPPVAVFEAPSSGTRSTANTGNVDNGMYQRAGNPAPIREERHYHTSHFHGPACYHHPDEPAVAQCARCGKNICSDCAEVYTVISGEYANSCLCYDCCSDIVAENVIELKKQKAKIITLFVATIIGMGVGLAIGCQGGALAGVLCMLWMGSFWNWIKGTVIGWWRNPFGLSFAGLIGSCLGSAVVAPFVTVKKIIQCIIYLRKTSKAIADDSEALAQMNDYMEYTQVMSRYKGYDPIDVINSTGELRDNAYARMVCEQGEAYADEEIRRGATLIAENGDRIKDFCA